MTNLNIKVGDQLKDCDPRSGERYLIVTSIGPRYVVASWDSNSRVVTCGYLHGRIHSNPARRSGMLHIPQGGGR